MKAIIESGGYKLTDKPDHLSSYWKDHFWLLLFITVTGIGYNIGMIANPYFQGRLINAVSAKSDVSSILALLVYYLLAMLIVQGFRAGKRFGIRVFAYQTTHAMRLNVYNNLLQEKPEDLQKENVGALLSRAMGDVKAAVEGMRKITTEIFDTVILFLSYIAYLFLFDPRITAFALIPVAFSILVAFVLRKLVYTSQAKSRKSYSVVSSLAFDTFDHALLYRVYGRDKAIEEKASKALSQYQKDTTRSNVLSDTMMPVVDILALVGLIPILYLGIGMVRNGTPVFYPNPLLPSDVWDDGLFEAYLTVFILLAKKSSHTAKLFTTVQKGLASWRRIQPFLKPYAPYESPEEVKKDDSLVLKDYTLTLSNKDRITNLSFTAKKGQIIGITGEIASGKSVFLKTLLKVLPYSGSMALFGKEVKDYSDPEIVGTISYMGHKADLLTDTLKDNVAYGDNVDVGKALASVSFAKDLSGMPEGEKTIVGNEGVKLSGGQQERIALARTLSHPKDLILLDDPFASIDVATEREIRKTVLEERKKESLILLVSHRLSLFPDLDGILVLEGNGRWSFGTHEELLKKSSCYKRLWELQTTSGEAGK